MSDKVKYRAAICFFLKLVLIVSCLTRVGNGNECEIPMTKWRWLRRHIINRNSCQMRTRRLSLSVCTISLLSHMYVSGISPKYAQTMVSWMRVVGEMGAPLLDLGTLPLFKTISTYTRTYLRCHSYFGILPS